MARYRKKPVEVEAWQFNGTLDDIPGAFLGHIVLLGSHAHINNNPLQWANLGEWVIREPDGWRVVPKQDFAATYEPVED